MNRIKALFYGAFIAMGSAAYLVLLALITFSLPLNVIVLMRWYDFEWWGALVTATLLGCIPFFGQLGYAFLTLVGAYYFVDAGFNWKLAIHPPAKELNIADLTDNQFEKFKSGLIPVVEHRCQADAKQRFSLNGSAALTKFCTCYAQTAVTVFTRADYIYQQTHDGAVSDDTTNRFSYAVLRTCLPEARSN
jgi:hypothetical protein